MKERLLVAVTASDQGDPGARLQLDDAEPARWGQLEPYPGVVALDARRRPPFERPETAPAVGSILRLLVVDGHEDDVLQLRELLDRAPDTRFQIDCAASLDVGMRRLTTGHFDACIVDYALADGDGLEFLRLARRRGVDTPIIVTGESERRIDLEAIELGAADYIDKEEFDVERLERGIRFAVVRQRSADRLGRLAQYDELTGLANRALFGDRLDRALAAARRRRGTVAVMLLDLNGFKPVNDRLGHSAGDRLLRLIANRLSSRVRETDTVARLGGDEFALVIEGLTRPEHAALVARKLLDAVLPPVDLDGQEVCVTASLGVAMYPQDADDAAILLRLADTAMYAAKAQGGNRCRFHDQDLDGRSRRGTTLANDLRRAIDESRLDLHFQPQMTLRPGELGVASQLRWRHPDLGIMGTARIRGLAEDSGLLEPMTDWLMTTACAQASAWQRQGLRRLHLAVPVLSRRQLGWSRLVERLRHQLEGHGLEPAMLEVEIEEGLLLEELEAGGSTLHELRELGVRLAVDAFGSACGSLTLLRDAPLRTLKVGTAMLDSVPQAKAQSHALAAIIRLARQLELRVVVDGIQSKGQLELVRAEGADAVQAIFKCPPLPGPACTDWLQQAAVRD